MNAYANRNLTFPEIQKLVETNHNDENTVFVFVVTVADAEAYYCPDCFNREFLDDTGKRQRLEQGFIKVRVKLSTDFDAHDHYCHGCDDDIAGLEASDHALQLGDTLPNGNVLTYQCPACGQTELFTALMFGLFDVAGDGQYDCLSGSDLEVVDNQDFAYMNCKECGHKATPAAFTVGKYNTPVSESVSDWYKILKLANMQAHEPVMKSALADFYAAPLHEEAPYINRIYDLLNK